jgi:D-glucuronyl C5-epimerase C-terminus
MKQIQIFFFVVAIQMLGSCCSGVSCGCADQVAIVDTVFVMDSSFVDPEELLAESYSQQDSCNGTEYSYEEFDISILPYDSLPYVEHDGVFGLKRDCDADGVPMYFYQGQFHYHPVSIAEYGLQMLDVYHDTKKPVLLDQMIVLADKLKGISMNTQSTMFFPYLFDFSLHGIEDETLEAPWYSSMAQGIALSFFTRLYEETGDQEYLKMSKRIFQSFLPLKGNDAKPWVSCVDKDGGLWLEEYPEEIPAMTLNGMNFAIYGVYDYYRITKSREAKVILMASLTTIKSNISRYRMEDDMSLFCIKHDVQSPYHHEVHGKQLHHFYLMTGDEYFEEMSTLFENDFVREY